MTTSLRQKIWLAFAIRIAGVMMVGALVFWGVRDLQKSFEYLVSFQVPRAEAAYEMEINVVEIATAIFKYLDAASPVYLEKLRDSQNDFEKSFQIYRWLSRSAADEKLAQTLAQRYTQYKQVGESLVHGKAQVEVMREAVYSRFNLADSHLHERLQPSFDKGSLEGREKFAESEGLEAALAESSAQLSVYLHTPSPEVENHIWAYFAEIQGHLRALHALRLTTAESKWAAEIGRLAEQNQTAISQLVAESKDLRAERDQFLALRLQLDDLLDDEIQLMAKGSLEAAQQAVAGKVVAIILFTTLALVVFLILSAGMTLLLIRRVLNPLGELMRGTEVLKQGDLAYRLPAHGDKEFRQLANNFNAMTAQLEIIHSGMELHAQDLANANRMKGKFLASMSHELRTPLNSIVGFSELLAEDVNARLGPEEKQYVVYIRQAGDHLLGLINDLLDMAKVEAGQLRLNVQAFPLDEAVTEVLAIVAPLAARKRIAFRAPAQVGEIVLGDKLRVKQILYNLIGNALKFSPEGGAVRLEASRAGDQVRVLVGDSGGGIPEEEQKKLFTEFHQVAGASADRQPGSGLGLAICKRLVEQMNGTIGVRSEPGKGSEFFFTLPSAAGAAIEKTARAAVA